MSQNKINAALQYLPLKGNTDPYEAVDKVIGQIHDSGLPYNVCPFETVVEGTTEECLNLIKSILESGKGDEITEFLLNVKFHVIPGKDVAMVDKTSPYDR